MQVKIENYGANLLCQTEWNISANKLYSSSLFIADGGHEKIGSLKWQGRIVSCG